MADAIRLEIDKSLKRTQDRILAASPKAWSRTPLDIHVGILDNGAISNIAEFSSIELVVKESHRRGAPYISKTIAAVDFDIALTLAEWKANENQHATFELSADDMAALNLISEPSKNFWLAVYGTLDDGGEQVMLGGTSFEIQESGINLGGDQPTNGANLVPPGAVYDVSGEYVLAVTQDVYHLYTKGDNDTELENGAETVTDSGATFISEGTSVTLIGTAGEPVTASVRYPIYLNADQIQAIGENVIHTINPAAVTISLISPDGLKMVRLSCQNNGTIGIEENLTP